MTAILGFDPHAGVWLTSLNTDSVAIPSLDGYLNADLSSLRTAATDWGQSVSNLPTAVLYPASITDIVEMVRFCRSFDIKIGARGQAHTMYGHSQVQSGVVIEMKLLNRIYSIDPDRASVEAGVTWRDLLVASVALGLTPPVLTDYISTSVGGTLSVGGISGTSYRHGAQIDNTIDLDIVTGAGHLMTCSMTQNRDLFEAALGGLGQCGIIVRASIKLVPAPSNARVYDMVYPGLDSLLEDFRVLLDDERFSYLEGLISAQPNGGYAYVLEGVSFYDVEPPDNSSLLSGLNFIPDCTIPVDNTYFGFCDRVRIKETALRSAGRWQLPHPWLDIFVPDSKAEQYMESVLGSLIFNDIPDFPCLIYGFRKNRLTCPLLRAPEEVSFMFNVLRTTDQARISQAIEENRQFYDLGLSLGGMLYPISAVPLSRHDWQHHFGPAYESFLKAKTSHDCDNILTPGPGIFS